MGSAVELVDGIVRERGAERGEDGKGSVQHDPLVKREENVSAPIA